MIFDKFKNITIEYMDDFGDEIYYYLTTSNIPKKFIKLAKNIDGDNYMFSCFRYCIIYNINDNNYTSGILEYVTENDGIQEITYLDNKDINTLGKFIDKHKHK